MSAATSSASAADVHESSAKGFSLAANTLYDAGRPTYNDECVDYLLNEAILDEVKTVLTSGEPSDTPQPLTYRIVDLGAGTGIMTRRLRARLDAFISAHSPALSAHNITFDLLAVEPVEGMRDRFKEKSPGLRVEAGSGSSMPTLENASVNLIIAAQAFHWFSTREALTEMARVLKPGGFFAPIWNTRDLDEPWIAETEKIIDPLYPDSVPRQQTGKWKDVFEPVSESPFALVSSREWKNAVVQTGSIDMILARIFSISVVAADTPENQAALKAKILDVVANHPDTRGKTEFTIPYKTDAYLYQKSCIVQ